MWILKCVFFFYSQSSSSTLTSVYVVYDYLCTLSCLQLHLACLKLLRKSFFAFTQELMWWHSGDCFCIGSVSGIIVQTVKPHRTKDLRFHHKTVV